MVFRRLGTAAAVVGGVAAMLVGAAAGPASADCDQPRLVSVSGYRAPEGSAAQEFTRFEFAVSSAGCPQPGAVRYETVAYTAGRTDFVDTVGGLELPAGDLRKQAVIVLVVPDTVAEPVECFSVRIAAAGGNVKTDVAEAAGIIVDDDRRGVGKRITEGFICSE